MIDKKLIGRLRNSQKVVALTGAGVSKESGIPTFREAQTGLWSQYDPTELATSQAFRSNSKLVWNWYEWRRELVRNSDPNPGHLALVAMEKKIPDFVLITQNVDGLHISAGNNFVIELHGNIMRSKCFSCGKIIHEWEKVPDPPPHCPICDGLLRPDVVWFGESLPIDTLQRSIEAARRADVFLSIGTSGIVHPAASLPIYALDSGAILVEVNPDSTPLTNIAHYVLQGKSGNLLPALIQQVWPDEM
jgi:NAD-dependent deacetylase